MQACAAKTFEGKEVKMQRGKLILSAAVASAALVLQAEFKAGFARLHATPPPGIPIVGYFHLNCAGMDQLAAAMQ